MNCNDPTQIVFSAARIHLASIPDDAIEIAAVLAANIDDSYSADNFVQHTQDVMLSKV